MYIDFKYLLQKYIQEHGLFGLIKLIAELTPPELAKSQIVEDIDKISKADKIIIIIETKNYIKKIINTQRPYCICTYPPLEIVDMVN